MLAAVSGEFTVLSSRRKELLGLQVAARWEIERKRGDRFNPHLKIRETVMLSSLITIEAIATGRGRVRS